MGEGIVMAGDGRHDSMGHCAKYGAYLLYTDKDYSLFFSSGMKKVLVSLALRWVVICSLR